MSTTARALMLEVRLAEGRYHGEPEWPPSPARLFQALVAGSARTDVLTPETAEALAWLEVQPPPTIAAPHAWTGRTLKLFVPNNDLDAKGGDPAAISDIRVGKEVRPRIFDPQVPLLYVWEVSWPDGRDQAEAVCRLALELYQLGRGVDPAWARAVVVDPVHAEAALSAHRGLVHRPVSGGLNNGLVLACPQRGSLASVQARFAATLARFHVEGRGKNAVQVFRQPPKPRFAQVAYDSPPPSRLFELRPAGGAEGPAKTMARFAAVPSTRTGELTVALRDAVVGRLAVANPALARDLERGLVGRSVEGLPPVPPSQRVRILCLPSVGHEHVDRSVRRVLVEVPAGNPLLSGDVFWAFSGLAVELPGGEAAVIVEADDRSMLSHYGVAREAGVGRSAGVSRTWRTATPVALPLSAARRRIDPAHQRDDAKGAPERLREEHSARRAVLQALRHAGVKTRVQQVRVQREPLAKKGERAEKYATGTRFEKERLWHVELVFEAPIPGPLVLGDGRFFGLGLFESVRAAPDFIAFEVVDGLVDGAAPEAVAVAFRRAVMARYQREIGARADLPLYVSGHEASGEPAAEDHRHLAYVYDPAGGRLIIVPPQRGTVSPPRRKESQWLTTLSSALAGFAELRAGAAGKLRVVPCEVPAEDPLLAASDTWITVTPYVVNRHKRGRDAAEALTDDVRAACQSAGLPDPEIHVQRHWGVPKIGLCGLMELRFPRPVEGPLLLGRTRHKGGGLLRGSRGD